MRVTFNHFIYKVSRLIGGHQIVRHLARDHPRILMYHRITEQPQPGAIDQESLRTQMRLIRQYFNPVSVSELVAAHEHGKSIPHAVAVTFDDGYSDFYDLALPVLRDEKVPATLFITTAFVDGDLWLWPDKLRYCFERTRERKLELPGFETPLNTEADRFTAWERLADHCLLVSNDEKDRLIGEVANVLNITLPDRPPEPYAGMNWDQVRATASLGFELGSHSVTHPRLTSLDEHDVAEELRSSRERIKAETGHSARAFCYPNGQPNDFDATTKAAIQNAGYDYALAAYPGPYPMEDPWAIKRYSATANQASFEKMLFGFTYIGMKGAPPGKTLSLYTRS